MVLVVVVVFAAAGGLLAVRSDDASADQESCHLARLALANQQGFSFTDEDNYCRAQRGDCDVEDSRYWESCLVVVVSNEETREDARALLPPGDSVAGLGEAGIENDVLLSAGRFDISFYRGNFVVDVVTTPLLMDLARTLAAQADAAIDAYLSEGLAILPTATPAGDDRDEAPAVDDLAASIMVNVFEGDSVFGDAYKPFFELVSERAGCPLDLSRPLWWLGGLEGGRCQVAAERSNQAMARLSVDRRQDLNQNDEDPLRLPAGGARAEAEVALAVWLANLEDADGQPLFPGVAASERVIMMLGRGGSLGGTKAQLTLTRLLSLTIGRDLLAWEAS